MAREQSGWLEQPGQSEQSGPAETVALMSLIEVHGFESRFTGSDIVLNNCPFHALAQEHPELGCGMNLHLTGFGGAGADGDRARLDPGPSRYCSTLTSTAGGSPTGDRALGVKSRPA